MGKELPLELRWTAEEMYVTGSLTFDEIARATGVSVSQLKRWAEGHDWQEARREYRQAFADIRRKSVELRRKLIEKALGSLDPQDVYAMAAAERIAAAADKAAAPMPVEPVAEDGEAVIRTPAEAVAALQSATERKLQRMLTQPDALNLAGLKEIQQMLDLVEKMQAKASPGAEAPEAKSLSDDKIREIREMLNL